MFQLVFALYIYPAYAIVFFKKQFYCFVFLFLFFNYFPLNFLFLLFFLFYFLFFFAVFILSSLLLRARAMFYLINQVCLLSRVQFAA